MSNRIARNISIILRSERLIAQRHMAVFRRQGGMVAAALIAAGVGLVMFNVAGFFALSEAMSPASAALIVALVNMALAIVLLVGASKATVGEEVNAVSEVRDMALEDLEAEVRSAADEAKAATDALKNMAKNPLGAITPSLASAIAKALVKTSKK
ncbi:hypothetical protein BXY66_1630 [Shimia isoporae]|uniref:Superfamily III holin-X n=1 Tax=Shimia isoporae TaxID=647720 RepID=A0A4R1NME2_9RHOB|nr:phage holin family protein [Shimia isoporae]TCL09577.1 hypothetical protein BXY66_1630 [Shimia isoporae]